MNQKPPENIFKGSTRIFGYCQTYGFAIGCKIFHLAMLNDKRKFYLCIMCVHAMSYFLNIVRFCYVPAFKYGSKTPLCVANAC